MGPGGPGLSSTIPQGGDTATAALLGPHRDALYSKRENSKRLYQHLRGFIETTTLPPLVHLRVVHHLPRGWWSQTLSGCFIYLFIYQAVTRSGFRQSPALSSLVGTTGDGELWPHICVLAITQRRVHTFA